MAAGKDNWNLVKLFFTWLLSSSHSIQVFSGVYQFLVESKKVRLFFFVFSCLSFLFCFNLLRCKRLDVSLHWVGLHFYSLLSISLVIDMHAKFDQICK